MSSHVPTQFAHVSGIPTLATSPSFFAFSIIVSKLSSLLTVDSLLSFELVEHPTSIAITDTPNKLDTNFFFIN